MYNVIDKLPQTCYNVLGYDKNGTFIGLVSYDFKKWWQERKELDNVVYWMDIPKVPDTLKLRECRTTFVADITVVDPDTLDLVEVELRKDSSSGGIVGIDSSYVETGGTIYSPYNRNDVLNFSDD